MTIQLLEMKALPGKSKLVIDFREKVHFGVIRRIKSSPLEILMFSLRDKFPYHKEAHILLSFLFTIDCLI